MGVATVDGRVDEIAGAMREALLNWPARVSGLIAAALAAFIAGKAEIDTLLARIQAASADHCGAETEAVTRGHAGRLGFVTERLKEVAAFLRV